MNAKSDSRATNFDSLKWIVVALVVLVGVAGNSYYSDQSLLYRVIALLVLAGAAGFVALQTVKGRSYFNLFKEAKAEIRKVVWPNRQETAQTTLVVVVVVVLMGLILWGVDSSLSWAVSGIIG